MGEAKRRRAAGFVPDGNNSVREPVVIDIIMSARAKALCNRIEPHSTPVILPFTPMSTQYEAGVCHFNVEHCVRQNGGERVPGWIIWDQNYSFAESEFHSVWRDPSGTLRDITPRVDGEAEVIFLPSRMDVVLSKIGGTILTNRTTMPHAPYTFSGMPSGPKVQVTWDSSTLTKIKRLGFE